MSYEGKRLEEIRHLKLRSLTSAATRICAMLESLSEGEITLTANENDPDKGLYSVERFLHMIHIELYNGLAVATPPRVEAVPISPMYSIIL